MFIYQYVSQLLRNTVVLRNAVIPLLKTPLAEAQVASRPCHTVALARDFFLFSTKSLLLLRLRGTRQREGHHAPRLQLHLVRPGTRASSPLNLHGVWS